MYMLIIIINDLLVHVSVCVDHLEIIVKRTEFLVPYCTYMITDGVEISALHYVASSTAVFLVVCFV
jgi:hypothetical protein